MILPQDAGMKLYFLNDEDVTLKHVLSKIEFCILGKHCAAETLEERTDE